MKTINLLIVLLTITISNSCSQNNNNTNIVAENMLYSFYSEYIRVFATEAPGLSSQNKLENLQKQFCTESLIKKIPIIIKIRVAILF